MAALEGKVAFITGAGRGQGRTHAVRLAEEGADIIAVDICAPVDTIAYPMSTAEDLAETAKLVEGLDRRIVARRADVRDRAGLSAAFEEGVRELGRIDIVCANAGIAAVVPAADMDDDAWQDMIDINLTGVWRTVNVALPTLIAQGQGGSIILVSSVQGIRGLPGLNHYVAAKHGVVGLTRSLGNELAPHNIRVNAVLPGNTGTPMMQNSVMAGAFVPGVESPTPEEFGAVSRSMHALPVDWIEPRDVSNAVAFLASDQARYVTSSLLSVDAGMAQK